MGWMDILVITGQKMFLKTIYPITDVLMSESVDRIEIGSFFFSFDLITFVSRHVQRRLQNNLKCFFFLYILLF